MQIYIAFSSIKVHYVCFPKKTIMDAVMVRTNSTELSKAVRYCVYPSCVPNSLHSPV